MQDRYVEHVGLFKALSDVNRLMIVDMLSCGELCAGKMLEKFNITQPPLSHHMRILCESGLVRGRKEGKWMYYTLNEDTVQKFKAFLCSITEDKEDCICKDDDPISCCAGDETTTMSCCGEETEYEHNS